MKNNPLENNLDLLRNLYNIDLDNDFEDIKDEDLFESYELTDEDKNEVYKTIKRDEFPDMRLFDLIEIKKKYSNLLNELETSKENIKSYFTIKRQMEAISKNINDKDLIESLSLKIDNAEDEMIKKFIDEYPKEYATLDFLLNIVISYIDDNFKDQANSTKFILNEMIYSVNKNIDKLELKKDDLLKKEYDSKMKMYKIALTALENKDNIDYIKSKFNSNNKSFITFIKKNNKFNSERIKRTTRIANDIVSEKQILLVIKFLTEKYNDAEFSISLVDYCANMLKSGISSGYTTYWKIFLTNLSFIAIGNFDLDIKPEEYISNIDYLYKEYKKAIEYK